MAVCTAFLLHCGGPETPVVINARVDTEIDFIYLYDIGRCDASEAEHASLFSVSINDDHRWGIYQPPNNPLRFSDIYIGSNAALEFAIALLPTSWDKPGDGVRFEIALETHSGETQILYSRYIDPKTNEEDRQWHFERVPIETFADDTANVVFRTYPSEDINEVNSLYDWSIWGEPRLLSDGRPERRVVPDRPNILLLTLDTTRVDFLSCYGSEWVQSPNLDRLAEEGVLFENAFSPNHSTNPTHLSLLSSLYPFTHEIPNNNIRLRRPIPTLPLIMKELGYSVAVALSVSHLDNIMGAQMNGVDHYLIPSDNRSIRPDFMTVSAMIDTLEQMEDDPFFFWGHFFNPHAPYFAVSPEHRMYYYGDPRDPAHSSMASQYSHPVWRLDDPGSWVYGITDYDYFIREYGSEITSLDRQIGRLMNALDRLGMRDNTLIVVTSDHGESFGEHGVHFDHWTLHWEDIHVPLIISHPRVLPHGVRIEADVNTIGIAPTILDMIGELDIPMAQTFEGHSLREYWEGEAPQPRLIVSDGTFGNATAVWDNEYKVIWELRDSSFHDGFAVHEDRVSVYDRINDPNEQNPVTVFLWRDDGRIDAFVPPDAPINGKPFRGEQYYNVKERKSIKQLPSLEELRDWFARDGIEPADDDLVERIQTLLSYMLDRVRKPGIYELIYQISGMPEWLSLFDEDTGEVDAVMIEHLRNLGYIQ